MAGRNLPRVISFSGFPFLQQPCLGFDSRREVKGPQKPAHATKRTEAYPGGYAGGRLQKVGLFGPVPPGRDRKRRVERRTRSDKISEGRKLR